MEASLQALICARRAPHLENARDIRGLIEAVRIVLDSAQAAQLDAALGPLTPDQISTMAAHQRLPRSPRCPELDPDTATPQFCRLQMARLQPPS